MATVEYYRVTDVPMFCVSANIWRAHRNVQTLGVFENRPILEMATESPLVLQSKRLSGKPSVRGERAAIFLQEGCQSVFARPQLRLGIA